MGIVIAFFVLVALLSLPQPAPQGKRLSLKWVPLLLAIGVVMWVVIWTWQGKI